jgi:leader peptidase (prepilin peptidase)/N-methyltransferase
MIWRDFPWVLLAIAVFGSVLGWWCAQLACRYACSLSEAMQLPSQKEARSASCALSVSCCLVLAGLFVVFHARYGLSLVFPAAGIAAALLMVLAVVDAKTSLLPDALTLPLLWLGLGLAWVGGPVALHAALAGAMAGYGFLFILFWLFKIVRKKEGMGYGDFKLLAALGAWVGVLNLPYVLLLACLAGLAYAVWRQKSLAPAGAYPFGPFLASSGVAVMAFAPEVHSYF